MTAVVIAVVNNKGGVGKTTVTAAISRALVLRRRTPAVIDLDPQANTGLVFGIRDAPVSIADVLARPTDLGIGDAVTIVEKWGVDVVPSDGSLGVWIEPGAGDPRALLREKIDVVRPYYDFILLDCQPGSGSLTLAALTSADFMLIVTEPNYLAMRGIAAMLTTMRNIQHHADRRVANPKLSFGGVIVNNYKRRETLAQEYAEELQTTFGDEVWNPVIHQRAMAGEMVARSTPLDVLAKLPRWRHDPRTRPLVRAFDAHAERMIQLA